MIDRCLVLKSNKSHNKVAKHLLFTLRLTCFPLESLPLQIRLNLLVSAAVVPVQAERRGSQDEEHRVGDADVPLRNQKIPHSLALFSGVCRVSLRSFA